MKTQLSYEAEEYVETIYRIQKQSGVAKTKDLAEKLDVAPGSITNTIEHLERHGLVTHEPYRGVKLTAKGERLALDIVRRHRLVERLLTDVLDAEWCDVHESACKLEHALTRDVIMLLERRLGNPKFCPHGNPIPTECGELREVECYTLTEVGLGLVCVVNRIVDEKRKRLQTLASKGIKPNASVHVVERKASTMVLCVDGKKHTLSYNDVSCILVKPVKVNNHAIQT